MQATTTAKVCADCEILTSPSCGLSEQNPVPLDLALFSTLSEEIQDSVWKERLAHP